MLSLLGFGGNGKFFFFIFLGFLVMFGMEKMFSRCLLSEWMEGWLFFIFVLFVLYLGKFVEFLLCVKVYFRYLGYIKVDKNFGFLRREIIF